MYKRILSLCLCIVFLSVFVLGCRQSAPANPILPDKGAAFTTKAPTETPAPTAEPDDGFHDPFQRRERADVRFPDIEYAPFRDYNQYERAAERIDGLCSSVLAFDEIMELYEYMGDAYVEMLTGSRVQALRYFMDTQNSRNEETYRRNSSLQGSMFSLLRDTTLRIMDSQHGDAFARAVDPSVISYFKRAPENEDFMYREDKLLEDYYRLAQKDFSVEFGGKYWTLDDVESSTLSETVKTKLRDQILHKQNEALAPLYVELVRTRRSIAQSNGYDDYIDYSYYCTYGRGYHPYQVAELCEYVKEYIVPAYLTFYLEGSYSLTYLPFDPKEALALLEAYVPRISLEMGKILEYMVEHEMYFFSDDPARQYQYAGVVTLDVYDQPFLYCSYLEDENAVLCLSRTFAHYCDAYLTRNRSRALQIFDENRELQSVLNFSLSGLFYAYYDEIFGKDSPTVKERTLSQWLFELTYYCFLEEAQQRIYALPYVPSAEEIGQIFEDTAQEYGFFNVTNLNWTSYSEIFTDPFKDIYFAVAEAAALEVWRTAQDEGFDAAREKFLKLLDYGTAGHTYFDVMTHAGIARFTSEESIAGIADAALRELRRLE